MRQPRPSYKLVIAAAVTGVLALVGLAAVPGAQGGAADRHLTAEESGEEGGRSEGAGEEPDGEQAIIGEEDRDSEGEEGEEGEENEGENIRKRERWFYSQRTGRAGTASARAYLKARHQSNRLAMASLIGNQPLNFTELGPRAIGSGLDWIYGGRKPYSGRVTAIAPHPTNASIVYIGTSMGGVWKTVNAGVNWTPLTDRLPSLAIGSVAVDPNNPNTVYVGTGESNLSGPSYLGAGVFKSIDGGATWSKLFGTTFDNCHISGIKVAPGNSNLVILAAHGTGSTPWASWSNQCANRVGVWRSLNGGTSFTRTLSNGLPTDLAVAPNNAAVWYVGEAGDGVWKSIDSGATWSRLAGLPTTGFRRIDLDVVSSTTSPSQTIYAALANTSSYLYGLYRSDNGGTSWTLQGASADVCKSAAGQCNYDLTVAISPSNPNRAYLGGVYLDRYTSGVPTRIGYDTNTGIHTDMHATAWDAAGNLWVGSDGGIYRTSDGSTFANLNADLGTILVYPGISGRYNGPIYAGAQDNGSFKYSGSRSWSLVGGGDGFFTAADTAAPDPGYTEVYYADIHKQTGGTTCNISETSGLTDAGSAKTAPFNTPLAMNPGNRNYLYAGTYRIWRSTNASNTTCGGTTWSLISQAWSGWVSAIGPAPNNTSVVYAATLAAGTTNPGLWVTSGSATWTDTAPNGLPARPFTDIAVSPTNSSAAWVTASGFDTGHVYATTNRGATWTNISGNLPNAPANAIAVDNRTTPATLFVGTDVGVFWSSDNGATWANTSVGLPNTVVTDLLVDKAADQLIVSTYGRGVWAASLAGATTPNDAFASAGVVGAVPFSQSGLANDQAGVETGEPSPSCVPLGKTLWWRYTPTAGVTVTADTAGSGFDTVLAVYRGTSLGGLVEVGCDDDGGGAGSTSAATVALTAGQTYYFQVGGWRDVNAGNAVASGAVSFHVNRAAPGNDAFASAGVVGAVPFSQSGLANDQAGVETGEPSPSCVPLGKTLWWRYTPTAGVTVTADTAGSGFDTVLAVYRGTSLGGLVEVGCDDDGGGAGSTSAATVALTAGQTYYFQVGGWRDVNAGNAVASGAVSFHVNRAAPGNDAFASAGVVGAVPFSQSGLANDQAGAETGEPTPSCAPSGKTLWWRYTPTAGRTVTADTAGSGFDTVLAVYRGTSLGGLVQVGCDDDGGGAGSTSAATVVLTAGQTYYFQVGGYKQSATTIATGSVTFHLN